MLFILFLMTIFALIVGSTIFWIWTIIDCATNEPDTGNDKLIWILVIIFTHGLGSLIYVLGRRPERIRRFGR